MKNRSLLVLIAVMCASSAPSMSFAQIDATSTATTSATTTITAETSPSPTPTATPTPTPTSIPTATPTPIPTPTPSPTPITTPTPVTPTPIPPGINNEAQVRAYFADIPVMIDIARCESKYREFADSGNVFRGGTANAMIGIFQIDERLHRSVALSMGMDINTVNGNMAYARYLYNRSRTADWIASMPCWNTSPVNEGGGQTVVPTLTATLYFGMFDPQVQTLQQILNRIGYTIATSGSGSPGNETTQFGGLTRATVRRFQCDQGIVCSGDEYSTSYGVVGPRTRTALLAKLPGGVATTQPSPTPSSGDTAAALEAARIAGVKAQISNLQNQVTSLLSQIKTLQYSIPSQ